jgi:hypothetical protein
VDRNGRSAWHAGGTRAPSLVKQGGPPWRIRDRCATGVVPQRATGGVLCRSEVLVKGTLWASTASNGMEWHERPPESAEEQRRAR